MKALGQDEKNSCHKVEDSGKYIYECSGLSEQFITLTKSVDHGNACQL
jgi:hypothetical protein